MRHWNPEHGKPEVQRSWAGFANRTLVSLVIRINNRAMPIEQVKYPLLYYRVEHYLPAIRLRRHQMIQLSRTRRWEDDVNWAREYAVNVPTSAERTAAALHSQETSRVVTSRPRTRFVGPDWCVDPGEPDAGHISESRTPSIEGRKMRATHCAWLPPPAFRRNGATGRRWAEPLAYPKADTAYR